MVFDRTFVSALVNEGFAIDTIIRPADDHEAWVLEFARVGGDRDCLSYSHKLHIKTYKTCAAALADAVGMKKVMVQMS